jgi:hypothetical protein
MLHQVKLFLGSLEMVEEAAQRRTRPAKSGRAERDNCYRLSGCLHESFRVVPPPLLFRPLIRSVPLLWPKPPQRRKTGRVFFGWRKLGVSLQQSFQPRAEELSGDTPKRPSSNWK